MLPTIAELLDFPEIQHGNPTVLARNDAIGHEVRWVHGREFSDSDSMLPGAEVPLTTGVALPMSDDEKWRFAYQPLGAEIVELLVGLGYGFQHPPFSIISAAQECDLSLVELRSTIPLRHVTETVPLLIVNRHVVELQRSERTHEILTSMKWPDPAIYQRPQHPRAQHWSGPDSQIGKD